MNVRNVNRYLMILFVLLAIGTTVDAGKLSSIRSATQGKPTAARPANKPASKRSSSSSRSQAREEKPEEKKERHAVANRPVSSHPAPVATVQLPNHGKLNRIRQAVRADHHVVTSPEPSRPHYEQHEQHRPARPAHRPARHPHSAIGYPDPAIGFYASYSSAVTLPTFVEEHHYYAAPPVTIVEPIPPAPQPVAIVYADEPAVVAATVIEHTQAPIVIAENPFEISEPFQVRFEIDYAGDEDVDRSGFGLLMNATGGLGMDTGVRIFRESGADYRDHLWLGDFNIVYELFPTKCMRTRAGVGVNWLSDNWGGEVGFNMTLGTELFTEHVILSGEIDLGTLGDTDLFHGRLTASWRHSDHLEWFAGYDYLDIGGTEIRGVVGGLRFRF